MSSRPKKIDVFNIYYINFSKVYEISMMINNVIVSTIQREKNSSHETIDAFSSNASISTALDTLTKIKGVFGTQFTEKQTNSSKLVESLDVKTTKSILLKHIDNRSKSIDHFTDCEEGDLIKIDNVQLKILNEENLREFKLFRSDALKGFQVDGVDVNNLVTSMLKDYSYLLYGKVPSSSVPMVIKIPMELENEFESKYNIDDLTIGKVSIIGVYKGFVREDHININTFNYLYDIGLEQQSNEEEEKVISSSYSNITSQPFPKSSDKPFAFIDVIAIVQNINFSEDQEEQPIHISWYKKVLYIFKKKRK
ncbi:hypothetical protein LCY76_22845 [Fictibacillus sp. KIGAM418]|uniref:Uncharacterized protein n=1 Tax=Fictibacillus marinisediminis TaxID=2878389 RepID=A0A9X1XEN4_9BACL|nr:hypothetical protein [Fictibacillus marinisediminis]MCK6259414.1 hypothetical protein [Fictibacillus marinisediminis]